MSSLHQILTLLLDLAWYIIIAHIVMSWLINFEVLNLRQPLVAQIWNGFNKLLQPIYVQIRRILPPIGGFDWSPMLLIFGLLALRILLANNIALFG